jgi:ATP-dependent protease HslVU (ClpYQ) peptidase subunit
MTCVVGLAENGRVWMGADSATTWDDTKLVIASNPKVFRVGPLVIGYCGSGRVGRLLQYSLTPPPVRNMPADKYVAITLVEAIRKCLFEGGVTHKENNEEEIPSDFLVGFKGRLWRVDGDFNVDESRHPFDSVGCGSHIALGAMHATQSLQPRQRLMAALRAAQEFNYAVRAPFVVLEPKA